jgi:hypothetical protein
MFEPSVGIINDPELATVIKTTDIDSLSCTYDEETRQIQFNWDAEKNPEYNYLLSMTSEELIEKMIRWATNEDAAVNTKTE